MKQPFFTAPDPKKSVNETELEVLNFWKDSNVFQESVESRNPNNEFVFFDGPPFATGTPHYGHILAGTIKDAIPRYWTMKGYRVNRKFGWDCHGLPVEYQVEKEQAIGGKPGIEAMGVDKFNEMCRSIVLRCRDEWEDTVDRMGRFVDFKNDYKTMDSEFMESVWWVFQSLWDKGLIYEGEKVVPYSPKLGSPLSNFEANLNYKDIDDPAVTVKFEILDEVTSKPVNDKKTYFLAWTTTPWTLPSNIALGFGKNHQYILLEHEGAYYWIAEDAATKYFPEDFEILDRRLGHEFLNVSYKPLFNFFTNGEEKRFICLHDDGDYVTTESGTGIVHFAPSFGAEDAELCAKFDVFGVNPIDENGYFTDQTPPLEGKYFRADEEIKGSKEDNANTWVMQDLKERGLLFKRDQIRHQYPFCWRTDCALMYRGIKTWFVKVSQIKEDLIANNQNINWTPSHLKDGRFGKILESAPDWAISRNRYWGCPLPIWRCDKTGAIEVIGSREELEAKTGQTVEDLHKHFVDELTWENKETGGTMRRIPEVLDCWFESGSMPYASRHFPFEKEHDQSAQDFRSANFISEGMDQTRGWFYTLHVLGTALFGKNIFDNVICSGIVLAEDGEKMSKSKKNYPDPGLIFEKYGADAMRFYLLQSPVATKGENLKFSEREVEEVLKNIILPLKNAYQFLSMYANIDGWAPTKFTLIRHGEAEHNVARIYSGKASNPHHLTKDGKVQAEKLAQNITPVDVLVASPLVRTQETAKVIAEVQGFNEKIITDERFKEVDFGELEGRTYIGPEQRLKEPSTEPLESIQKRSLAGLKELKETHQGSHIGIVSHGGTIRSLQTALHGITKQEKHLEFPAIGTGQSQIAFCPPESENELDQWIMSELQTLIENYKTDFDQYDTEGACRAILPFIDKLNNWYLRRSRKRFWAEGLDADKQNAYETLHYTLFTVSKILAPIMPFFADWLYQKTSGEQSRSVHVDFVPFSITSYKNEALETKVGLARDIVRLAASIRSRQKIKLRQPLQKLQFALTQEADLDLETIANEANVKKVEILQSVDGIAQQIIKVDARKVGRKFGKKVQTLIQAGKSGDFSILPDGKVEIMDEVLEADEYELAFITEEGVEADATPDVVVILNTEITEDLAQEGLSREVIRSIQDLRKQTGFEISDRIEIIFETNDEMLKTMFVSFGDNIAQEVLATNITEGSGEHLVEIEGRSLKLSLNKHS